MNKKMKGKKKKKKSFFFVNLDEFFRVFTFDNLVSDVLKSGYGI